MTIAPCIYPKCSDTDGNPILTTLTICDPSRHHYRRNLDRIVLDYIEIATTMPTPITTDINHTRGPQGTPGHPRAWASDTLRHIAEILDGAETSLRDHRHDTPPAPPGTIREARLVNRAWTYLTHHFDDLCTYPGAQATATEVYDTHNHIRRALGHTTITTRLPTACPWCELTTLVRTIDRAANDTISCDNCHHTITDDLYTWFARRELDHLIDTADTPNTATV